jgi:hypothetical protein
MHKYLPSKKFSLILLSIIIALGIVYGFYLLNKPELANPALAILQNGENKIVTEEYLVLDTDSDGLKDWEEALWKTDLKISDTDADGATDGEEVNTNRNPLKANTAGPNKEPNDKIAEEIIVMKAKAEEDFKALTTTEKISRELFAQYIMAKRVDSALSSSTVQRIVNTALSYVPEIKFKAYTKADIMTTTVNNDEILRNYANKIGEIIITNLKDSTDSVDEIITDASNIQSDENLIAETEKIFTRFAPLVNKNKNTVSSLLKVTVPETLLAEHLKLLNSFQEIFQSLELMQSSAGDIIILVLLKDNYQVSAQNLADALVNMLKKVAELKISFINVTDYGYQLFGVIMLKE